MDEGLSPVGEVNDTWPMVLHRLAGDETVELTADPARVDVAALLGFLSTAAYWGRWRDEEVIRQQVAGAWRVVTAHRNGRMVGFARALSDGVSLAYLADVYVLPEVRGFGIGRALVRLMIDDGPGAEILQTHTWSDRDAAEARARRAEQRYSSTLLSGPGSCSSSVPPDRCSSTS